MTNLYSEAVELTRELVRLPSENPPATEQRVGEFVAQWLRRVPGVEVEVFEVQPGRSNVVGRLRSGSSAPAVAILAHMDTVPVGDGWSKDPFGGEIEHGRLYGRGSCDMKAGLACAMVALKRAAAQKSSPRRDILVCATVDEEGSHMLGGMDLIRHGIVDKDSFVVATEPTGLEIIIAHKGLVWLEVEAIGKLAHAGILQSASMPCARCQPLSWSFMRRSRPCLTSMTGWVEQPLPSVRSKEASRPTSFPIVPGSKSTCAFPRP